MKELTDEQLNIAICEWRGWTRVGGFDDLWENRTSGHRIGKLPSHITGIEALGNMHEAEKGLNAEQQMQYARLLHEPLQGQRHYLHIDFDVLHATARQRAIALLRVVKPKLFNSAC